MGNWTFLTNHAHALLAIAQDPGIRIEEIAARVGITQRAAHRIVTELAEEGYLTRTKIGRRIRYTVHRDTPLRHPMDRSHDIGELLAVLTAPAARIDSEPSAARLLGSSDGPG